MMTRRCVLLACCVAGLGPPAAVQAQLPDSLVAQIRTGAAQSELRADTADLPLLGTPTLPLVEVMINGHGPYRFLVDLGSNVVVVRNAVAASAEGAVLVDRPRGDIIRFDSISLGALVLRSVVAAGYDSLDVDGVLGYNVLQYHSFDLDYPRQRLTIHDSELPAPDFREILPYSVDGRMPMLLVRIGSDSLRVNLDTGATEWLTIPPALQDGIRWAGQVRPGRMTWNNQTGAQQVHEGTLLDPLEIGPLVLSDVLVYINPDADGPWLGSSAMQHARWSFDPRNQRVRITPKQ
ncbi:MAG TPA: aspartyl protease family protein [Longimicrobiales bacterium]|nr:aspartyl protease family protein [Longimicrobiales bacterium]